MKKPTGASSDIVARLVAADPGLAALLSPGGRPLREGAVLRQGALARTLAVIAQGGADGFHHGPLSDAVNAIREQGGLMEVSDLSAREPFWCRPQ